MRLGSNWAAIFSCLVLERPGFMGQGGGWRMEVESQSHMEFSEIHHCRLKLHTASQLA